MEISVTALWNETTLLGKGIWIGLILLSIVMVFVIIERFVVYYKGSSQTFSFVRVLEGYLSKRSISEAIGAAKRHPASPVAKVMESGLEAYDKGREALAEEGPEDVGDFDLVDSVNRALERVKERETAGLRRGLGWLATVASVSPFVGLLGTVVGIIGAFHKIKDGGTIDVIGPSIAEALIFTAAGLIVAIIAAIVYNYYTGRVENIVVDMNDVSSEFVDYVLKEGRA
jgi:biopolymer transport protein ExbB